MSAHLVVIGKTGQLARALRKEISQQTHKNQRLQTADFIDRETLDLTSTADVIRETLDNLPPCDAIILAAAYTAVDQAETDIQSAMAVNARAPGIIAQFCKDRNIPLIHISTDYVFSGKTHNPTTMQPYKITDETAPLNVYGRSKREGELAIQASKCRYAILRTSWVYDGLGKNFLTTMLRLAQTHDTISVVHDQYGRPTYARHLAAAVLRTTSDMISDKEASHGLFHVTNTGPIISWSDFAQAIFKQQSLKTRIKPITTAEYPTPAQRPFYSVMDTSKFESLFDYTLPNWQAGLTAALAERQ